MTEEIDLLRAAVSKTYPNDPEKHWGVVRSFGEGGPDPLSGVSAYRVEEPAPHWHYVGYDLSLPDRAGNPPGGDGFGIELTFRLARREADTEPPLWPVVMMQTMARYVVNQRLPFGHGHYIAFGGPLGKGVETQLVGLVFSKDPTIAPAATPQGTVEFIQGIGLTQDELDLLNDSNSEGMLTALEPTTTKVYVTDVARASIVGDAKKKAEVLGILRDASARYREQAAASREKSREEREAAREKDREAREAARKEREEKRAAEKAARDKAREAEKAARDKQREDKKK